MYRTVISTPKTVWSRRRYKREEALDILHAIFKDQYNATNVLITLTTSDAFSIFFIKLSIIIKVRSKIPPVMEKNKPDTQQCGVCLARIQILRQMDACQS